MDLASHAYDVVPMPEGSRLWLGCHFPIARRLALAWWDELRGPLQHDRRPRPRHNTRPNINAPHPHHSASNPGQTAFSSALLSPAPAASAVAPPALILPVRLPANTRYVNTTPCLSYPHVAHHKLTLCNKATTAGHPLLPHVRRSS